jgi:streptogramin lyase
LNNQYFNEIEGSGIDTNGYLWAASVGSNVVSKVNLSTHAVQVISTPSTTTRAVTDGAGNAWFNSYTSSNLFKVTGTSVSNFTAPNIFTGTKQSPANPEGMGVDGAGNIWVGYAGTTATSAVTAYSSTGVCIGNYAFGGQNGTRGAQVDGSGNVWLVENGIDSANIIELVGVATPVVTPVAIGVLNNTLGTRP